MKELSSVPNQSEKTDNELIAEFMGLRRQEVGEYGKVSYWKPDPKDKRKRGSFVGYFDSLKYEDSWNDLIPVVEKINKINLLDYNIDRDSQWLHEKVVTTRVNCELQFLYKAVVEFIKWYNSQKK